MFLNCLILILLVVNKIYCGFQKDMGTNTQFPPILDYRTNSPTGHLRPLGWQNRPESQIIEETVNIAPRNFWNSYVQKNRPVIIRGLVYGSEIIETWTDTYFE